MSDEFEVLMWLDQRLIDTDTLWDVNFDVDFPKDQMTLVGIHAHPYIVDPNTGTPINYTGVFVPNTSGNLEFHFHGNPFDYDGNGASTNPLTRNLGTLTFKVKDFPDVGYYNLQPHSTLAYNINGEITDFQNYSASVNIVDHPVEPLYIEIDPPVYGESPIDYYTFDDYSMYLEWFEVDENGQFVTFDGSVEDYAFKADTIYGAFFNLEGDLGTNFSNALPIINGMPASDVYCSPDSTYALEGSIVFMRTEALPNIEGGVSLSTNTPGYADTNPIVASAYSSLPNVLPFHYRWYRDDVLIPDSDNSVYSVVLADIGKQLRVEVYSDNYSGYLSSVSTAVVTKGQQNVIPPVPAELTATADSITILNKKSDQEYGISTSPDNEPTVWGFDDFTDLAANTDYYIFTRLAETPGLFAGPAVSTHIKTAKLEQVINGPDSETIDINASLDLDALYQSNVVDADLNYSVISNTAAGTVLTDNVLQAGSTAGEVAIRITAAEAGDYAFAVKDVTIVVFGKMASQFAAGFSDGVEKHYGEAPFTKAASLQVGDGAITYSTDNAAVATVNTSTGAITIIGVGEANITAKLPKQLLMQALSKAIC